jgi:hypothetical protein
MPRFHPAQDLITVSQDWGDIISASATRERGKNRIARSALPSEKRDLRADRGLLVNKSWQSRWHNAGGKATDFAHPQL